MLKKNRIFLTLLAGAISPVLVFAAGTSGNAAGQWLLDVISRLLTIVLWPIFTAFVIFTFIYIGYQYMSAKGADKAVEVNKALIWAVVGISVAILGYGMVNFIKTVLPAAPGTTNTTGNTGNTGNTGGSGNTGNTSNNNTTNTTGACCESGSCIGSLTQANCSGSGGLYVGDNTTCSFDTCSTPTGPPTTPTGACCVGQTCNTVTASNCNGIWFGENTTCTGVVCSGGG